MIKARDERFWNVVAVFDPDGGGADFAYTVGLADRGLRELHVWARPAHGDDPGADWKFSNRDLVQLRGACAERALAGSLGVGSMWSERYDGGLTQADFVAGELVDRLDVDAYQARDGVLVLPIRWSLHRPLSGVLAPLGEAAERSARSSLERMLTRVDPPAVARLPERWRPARDVSFEPGQPYGPLSPLVVAAGAEIATASAADITGFSEAVLALVYSHGHRYGDPLIDVEARQVDRAAAVEAARDAGREITRIVVGREAKRTDRWRLVIDSVFRDTTGAERHSLAHGLAHAFEDAVATYLAVHVVGDVASDVTRRAGFGPWYWGRCRSLAAPGSLWWAPAEVLDRVSAAVGPMDAASLVDIGLRFDRLLADRDDHGGRAYQDRVARLRGLALTQPIGMPHPESWLRGTTAGATLAHLALGNGGEVVVPLVVEALGLITAAVAAAKAGIDHNLADVLSPYADLLPGLLPGVSPTA